MKLINNNLIRNRQILCIVMALIIVTSSALESRGGSENASYTLKLEDVITSARLDNIHFTAAANTASRFHQEFERLGAEVLAVLKDKKASDANKCIAAYYLGEMRFQAAAHDLAANISINLENADVLIQRLPVLGRYPSRDALAKIGCSAIPAVIENLAGSDDSVIRNLSVDVLFRIDDDKEMVQLRLRKALKDQKDHEKKARLELALKMFDERK